MSLAVAFPQGVTDIFMYRDRELTFFGIDFSAVKLVGAEFSKPQEIKDVYFGQWNSILVAEGKYDLRGPLHRKNIVTDFSAVEKRNKDASVENMTVYGQKYMSVNDVAAMIEQYDCGVHTGPGLVFITDLLDRDKNKAIVHVVFFDIATKTVLLHEVFRGNPGGAGMRNYWANAFADIISKIADTRYKEWELMFFK